MAGGLSIAVLAMLMTLWFPANGRAFYAGPFSTCRPIENGINKHCYALSSWTMEDGKSSGVNGATLELINLGTSVGETPPGSLEEYFVTNEMWTGFHDIPNSWVESGQLTNSSNKPEAFYAFQNQVGESFRKFIAPVNLPDDQWFWVENLYVGNGVWESYIEGAGPFQMVANLPGGADEPQNGLEMNNETVTNHGESYDPVWEAPSGQWQYGWYDKYSTAVRAAPGWEDFGNWAGHETAPTCALRTGTPGAVKWTSWPYPNPDQESCFWGDNNVYSDVAGLREPFTHPSTELLAHLRPASEQPPVNNADFPHPHRASGPVLAANKVRKRALAIAKEAGSAQPTDIESIELTRGAAIQAANPGLALPPLGGTEPWEATLRAWYAEPVDLVTAYGNFTATGPMPAGSAPISGTVLTSIIDAHTGAVTMTGINNKAPVSIAALRH